jgi:Gamma-glutamyl cyclotransferase, AIG2-like
MVPSRSFGGEGWVTEMTYMFLNGGGMAGGSLHHLLRGAPLVAETTTAPRYRLHSVGDRYPALEPVADDGTAVNGEVYDVPLDVLRDSLLPQEPPELELGIIELADGSPSLGMILRRPCPPIGDLTDISAHGGWRAYQAQAQH